jgi:2-polyprenyl-6-methoxyphenol hydroxylase-like FAD-dependent oxidoreductase
MEGDTNVKCLVAVVGSGMAGLVTAYLLNRDPEHRYNVEVFEIVSPPK